MWLVIRCGGVHLFGPVGQITERQKTAAKVLLGFPPGHAWVNADWVPNELPNPTPGREMVPGLDVSVQHDPLHGDLLAVATVHPVAELAAVTDEQLAAYDEAHQAAVIGEQLAGLSAALTQLPDEALAQLLAEHSHRLENP